MLLRFFSFFISFMSLTQAYEFFEGEQIKPPSLSTYFHKGENLKDWKIEEKFIPYRNKQGDTVHKLTLRSLKTDIYIKKIHIRIHEDGHRSLHIFSRTSVEDTKRILERYIATFFKRNKWICATEQELSPFLSLFYQKDLLPDFILDSIFSNIEIDDFRTNEKTFLEKINQKLTPESSLQDFKKILEEELKKVKDPKRSQNLTALLICDLIHSNPDRSLILELCQQIQDPKVSLFNEVRKIESDLIFTDDSGTWTKSQRQSQALHCLLRTNQDEEAKKMMALEVKAVFFGDKVTSESIPAALQDFIQAQNPDSTTTLLMFIGDQQRQIRELQEQISRLKLNQN